MTPIIAAVIVGSVAALVGVGLAAQSGTQSEAEPRRKKRPRDESRGREYVLYLGQQRSGKTYQLQREIERFAAAGCKVFVADVFRGFGGLDGARVFRSKHEWDEATRDEIPRVSVFQLGEDATAYEWVWDEAVREADPYLDRTSVIVCDEWWSFAPMGAHWRGSKRLREVLLAGRHCWNAAGEECEVHVVGATQYPYSMHLLVWQQAYTVYLGASRGDRIRQWLRREFGAEVEARADSIEPREWRCLCDKDRPRGRGGFERLHPWLVRPEPAREKKQHTP